MALPTPQPSQPRNFFERLLYEVRQEFQGRKRPQPVPPKAPLVQISHQPHFEILPLGSRSGDIDGNLSAYMVRALPLNEAILCDAGTLGGGLKFCEAAGALADIPLPHTPANRAESDAPLSVAGRVLTETIRAYCISHAHLDHVAGLVLTSPDDVPKPIYMLPPTQELISAHLFNNQIWGNMGDKGPAPQIGKYHYQAMETGTGLGVPGTGFTLQAWPLAHANLTSTAFELRHSGHSVLYLGDTAPDQPDSPGALHALWEAVAPRIKNGTLSTILIETTYPNTQPADKLRSHLTPQLLLATLHDLAAVCGGRHALRGLTVIITHVKETFAALPENPQKAIQRELEEGNNMGIRFIMAQQATRYLV
ncbi:3',5'-cyclic-nucleotide phosphodiesterase [Formicincola oecophyllae]|uniref:3',5'-cyclic-nucleotide phosphodiesterase n=1 Tax=Formicincola oecophyllae TaxID=2558361 RepID=A0A4Y6U9D8_9PROT|nr:3',5'-cyclic-nucleotide phosphodiesterase [Formicincola oecophyllae]QDH13630.1 3',5'-cyclic-nucleotide phosphodiesterase [Formicincola oecophyllae]